VSLDSKDAMMVVKLHGDFQFVLNPKNCSFRFDYKKKIWLGFILLRFSVSFRYELIEISFFNVFNKATML